jgi:formate hydrogenlyase subunit 4
LPLSLTQDWQRLVLVGLGQICIAIIIGVIESVTARLRLIRLPQFIVGAGVLACIGLTLVFFQQ